MKYFFRTAGSVAVLTSALTGCIAPGMHMNISQVMPTVNDQNQIVKPVVQTITAQLVQAQTTQAQATLADEKTHYHAPKGFYAQTSHYHYRVAAQDVLQITVWNQSVSQTETAAAVNPYLAQGNVAPTGAAAAANTNDSFIVDGNGNIFYPYLGQLPVARKTVSEVRQMLTLKMAKYIENPQITVRVMNFNGQKIAITGAVRSPMNVPITNIPLNVLTAVTLAGGPLACNASSAGESASFCADLHNVQIQRGAQTVTVNLNRLSAIDGSSSNWILKNGDTVYVPNNNESRIFVLGAANAPGPYNMIDGKMTLRDALGDAAGVNSYSSPGFTYVVRNYNRNPEIYWLDLSSPDALNLAGDFSLKPNDVVFVSISRLQDFANVVNQVAPTLASAAYAKTLTH